MKLKLGSSVSFLFLLLTNHVSSATISEDEQNPFMDMASAFLQNGGGENMAALGGFLGNLMQSKEGQNLGGSLLSSLAGNNAGLNGDILSGIGNLLTNGQGNFDPSILGNVLEMISETNNINSEAVNERKKRGSPDNTAQEPSLGQVLGDVAQGLLGQNLVSLDGIMTHMPMLMSTLNAFTGPEAADRARDHAGHSWMLPPAIEQLHIFWDHFMHTDLAKTLYKNLNFGKFASKFTNEKGEFDFDLLVKMIENQSFRKYWLKFVAGQLTDLAAYFADPATQKKYVTTGQFIFNGFLKARGYPKYALFDPNRPSETLTRFADIFIKKYFSMKIDTSPYITPIVHYIQEIIELMQAQSLQLKHGLNHDLANKIADTLNMELIEPVLRTARAYRYSRKEPKCAFHVLCTINRRAGSSPIELFLSRGTSLAASWFLSIHHKAPFWSYYSAVLENVDCQTKYPVSCNDFHAEEVHVTKDYMHNEL